MTKLTSAIAVLAVSAFALAAPAYADCSAQAAANSKDVYFVADSFSFGVEREMKESGEKAAVQTASSYTAPESEKGGTEDINIGVGELQECTISKSN